MPIVFVHGVANRDPLGWTGVEQLLRAYVAPVLNPKAPDEVHIGAAYWGDIGVQFRWGGRSRPRSLLGMGSTDETDFRNRVLETLAWPELLKGIPLEAGQETTAGSLIASGAAPRSPSSRWSSLNADDRSDLLNGLIVELLAPGTTVGDDDTKNRQLATLLVDADRLARNESEVNLLRQMPDAASEAAELQRLLTEQLQSQRTTDALIPQGVLDTLKGLGSRLDEALSRAASWPSTLASRIALQARPPLNNLITLFFGDVFWYLARRGEGTDIGEIPQRLLDALYTARKAPQMDGEPLVVLTHSMGGQLMYDALTHFLKLDKRHADTRIDFWCATASQVGLFLEMGLFRHQMGIPAPAAGSGRAAPPIDRPDAARLGAWWNVWDPNDVLSFTVQDIVRGVKDEPYDSGLPFTAAHSGCLQRVSFYRRLAEKIEIARAQGWSLP
ncbi:hypothetical protein [Deinococcus sp. AJ005]|uniref:hypothetical protein n=1 Tax=Deinococcus sp. AJ005 TaxID=2652443 RepID=UPI00125CBA82|nr:hypothetical protein [Deinococcus sp. AJ005]QFP75039.1 hypothetical protein DAAJ005_00295 [Deinococcus sp. AJ005]